MSNYVIRKTEPFNYEIIVVEGDDFNVHLQSFLIQPMEGDQILLTSEVDDDWLGPYEVLDTMLIGVPINDENPLHVHGRLIVKPVVALYDEEDNQDDNQTECDSVNL